MKTLSASQISTFLSCQRAWSYAYIDGRRPPGTKSTQLGQDIHRELEQWSLMARAPTSPQARLAIAHIPAPGIASAEMALSLQTASSPWRGSLDLVYDLDANGAPAKAFTTGHTVVLDFKTTSALSWAKTAEYLAEEDTQAALYAAFARSKGATKVSGKWLYLTTKGAAKAHPVTFDFDQTTVQKNVDNLDETAAVVQKLYSLRKKTEELPQSLGHCSAFGGCFHRETCHKSPMAQSNKDVFMSTDFRSFIDAAFPSQAVPLAPPAPVMAMPPAPPPPPAPPLTEDVDGSRTEDFFAQTVGPKAALRIMEQVKKESVLPPPPPPAPAYRDPVDENMELLMMGGLGLLSPANQAFMAQQNLHAQFAQDNRPMVERGTVNPPEAPLYAPASPEEAAIMVPVINTSTTHTPDVLDSMDRGALKALNIRLGLCTDSSRFQEPKLRANIREYAQTHAVSVDEVVKGPSVDSSEPSVGVSSGLPPIEDCQFRGEQLEADRLETRPEVIREYKEALGLTSEEREAVQVAISEAKLTEDDHFAAIRAIFREELGSYFAARFGR